MAVGCGWQALIVERKNTVGENESVGAASAVRARLMKTISLQSVDLMLKVTVQLIMVPILIGKWGTELYQDWIVLFAGANFLSFLDFGMQTYFTNTLLRAWVEQDHAAFRKQLGNAVALYAAVILASIATLGGLLALFPWADWLGIRAMSYPTAAAVASSLCGSVLALIPLGIFTGIYRVRGDYNRSIAVTMVTQSMAGLGLCILAALGGKPLGAAVLYGCISVAAWIGVVADQRRRYREFPARIEIPTASELKTIVMHSAQYLTPVVSTPLLFHLPIVLLGSLGGAGTAVVYSVTRTAIGLVRQVTAQPNQPVGMEVARYVVGGDAVGARSLFLQAVRITCAVSGLLGGFVLVMAEPIIGVWTHGQVPYDPWLVLIMVGAVVLMAPSQAPFMFFYHLNQPRVLAVTVGIHLIIATILCAWLSSRYAATGAALAIGGTEVVLVGLVVPFAACSALALSTMSFLRAAIRPLLFFLILGAVSGWSLRQVFPIENIVRLLLACGLWAGLLGPLAFFLLFPAGVRAAFDRLRILAFG